MNLLAIVMLSIFSLFAVTSSAAPPKPAPAKGSPPKPTAASKAATAAALSKYQRDRLEGFKNSAPADRYFGRMKLSYLGINNTLRDAAITSGPHTIDAAIITKISFAEDALTDWEKHYPRDPQLARTYFLAIQSEKKIWVRPNQERAWTYMNRIVKVFPVTYFGKIVKKDMAVGFTQHYYADAVPCETPTPEPVQTPIPEPSATPAPSRGSRSRPTPTPQPTATPSPTPTPEPTAVPTPEVRTLAKGLKVQIEIPACVRPATPSPSPSAIPSATPLPVPSSASPAPGAPPAAPGASPAASRAPSAAPSAPSAAPSAPAATSTPAPSPAGTPGQPAATTSPRPAATASPRAQQR